MLAFGKQMNLRPLRMMAMICVVLTAGFGCDQITGDSIVQIIGEVTMNRKPLADTKVAFIPLEFRGGNGMIKEIAYGLTDNAGRFQLRTSEAKGIVSGEYRVLFFKPDSNAVERPAASTNLEELTNLLQFGNFDVDSLNLSSQVDAGDIPVTYNIESEIRFSVEAGAGVLYPKFELQSHPEI